METPAAAWLVLVVAAIAANLPFVTERLGLVGPRLDPKPLVLRLLELLLLCAATVGVGMLLESQLGQRQQQGWEFYVAMGFLFTTLAFPGFVWRYLNASRTRRGPSGPLRSADEPEAARPVLEGRGL